MLTSERDARFEAEALACLPDVARFARSLTREASAADDLVQETFLLAYKGYASFKSGSDLRRWLFSICHHAFLRQQHRDRRVVLTDDGDDAQLETLAAVMGHVAAQRSGLDAFVCAIDMAPAIRDAIDRLAPPFRLAVVLVDIEDMSYEDAAAVAEVPVGTIRSRLFRARRLLQDQLFAFAADAGFRPPASKANVGTEPSPSRKSR